MHIVRDSQPLILLFLFSYFGHNFLYGFKFKCHRQKKKHTQIFLVWQFEKVEKMKRSALQKEIQFEQNWSSLNTQF